jgi:hypothetical protein
MSEQGERFTFHGPIMVRDIARALIAEFNQGTLKAQAVGDDDQLVVQIATSRYLASGGRTAISIHLLKIEDGVRVEFGDQEWVGVALSLGRTALSALLRPASILGRLDDLAADVNALQIKERALETIQRTAEAVGASFQISERLRRLTCVFCTTANPVGEPHCIACGAPMGPSQPITCSNCGYVTYAGMPTCPECGEELP